MARVHKNAKLFVGLNGRLVGTLHRATTGAISFVYDKGWLSDTQRAIPISLSLPLREEHYTGMQVSAFFDNLLPDNNSIRRRVAEKVGAQGTDAFSLLDKIGHDCVGALQIVPDESDILPPALPRGQAVTDKTIADIVQHLSSAPLGIDPNKNKEFRISIAGAQEKTALLWNDGWYVPEGITPTTHIFKPALGKLPNGIDMTHSVENEHFCLTLCRAFGLESAQSEIVTFDSVRVLVVKRFDRLTAQDDRLLRVPQEDFCQALGVPASQKYNSDGGPGIAECLALLSGSDYAEKDRRDFLKAQILFWMIGATDGHAKNFSVFLTPGGGYRMTPLYDIMTAESGYQARQLRRQEYRLAMAVGNNRHYQIEKILPRHFAQSAAKAGMPEETVQNVFDTIAEGVDDAIDDTCGFMPPDFPAYILEIVSDAIRSRGERIRRYRDTP